MKLIVLLKGYVVRALEIKKKWVYMLSFLNGFTSLIARPI